MEPFDPPYLVVACLAAWVAAQAAVLTVQLRRPRVLVPAALLPVQYDYRRRVTLLGEGRASVVPAARVGEAAVFE